MDSFGLHYFILLFFSVCNQPNDSYFALAETPCYWKSHANSRAVIVMHWRIMDYAIRPDKTYHILARRWRYAGQQRITIMAYIKSFYTSASQHQRAEQMRAEVARNETNEKGNHSTKTELIQLKIHSIVRCNINVDKPWEEQRNKYISPGISRNTHTLFACQY